MFAFIGTTEILVILAIALLVFGPAKLPEIGRQIGSAMRELRKMSNDVQRAFDIDDYRYDTRYDTAYSYRSETTDSTRPWSVQNDSPTASDEGAPVEAGAEPIEVQSAANTVHRGSEPASDGADTDHREPEQGADAEHPPVAVAQTPGAPEKREES